MPLYLVACPSLLLSLHPLSFLTPCLIIPGCWVHKRFPIHLLHLLLRPPHHPPWGQWLWILLKRMLSNCPCLQLCILVRGNCQTCFHIILFVFVLSCIETRLACPTQFCALPSYSPTILFRNDSGGKQYKVRSMDLIITNKLPAEVGDRLRLEKVWYY